MFFTLLVRLAYAGVSLSIVNNTRLEFNAGTQLSVYVANEIQTVLGSHNSYVLDKNKFRVGIRHKANDYVKLDPHIFLQNQRKNDWALEYGPTLRIDVNF